MDEEREKHSDATRDLHISIVPVPVRSAIFYPDVDDLFTAKAAADGEKDYVSAHALQWELWSTSDSMAYLWREGTCLSQANSLPDPCQSNHLDTESRIHPTRKGRFSDSTVFWSSHSLEFVSHAEEHARQYFAAIRNVRCDQGIETVGLEAPFGSAVPDHLDLSEVQLAFIKVPGVWFRCIRLYGPSLAGGDLRRTTFEANWLNYSDLQHTDLSGAQFKSIQLDGANLDSAIVDEKTVFQDIVSFHTSNWTGVSWWLAQIRDDSLRAYLCRDFPPPADWHAKACGSISH